ncbi:unnamed protein product [Mytilus coruscus]|uniref:Uncharacterized protein n=1 Tax=Mytilus coruscus TaxID=42192 RepID=A0A6J8E6Q9_MYTCO|nr:unnamed protein product [Mytilus coruscus]
MLSKEIDLDTYLSPSTASTSKDSASVSELVPTNANSTPTIITEEKLCTKCKTAFQLHVVADLCDLCSRVDNIRRHRHQSGEAMRNQASNMVIRSNRILRPINIVLDAVPNVDPGNGDPRNLLCSVLEDDDGHYKLGIIYCILVTKYSRSQFTLTTYHGLKAVDFKNDIVVSAREQHELNR